MPAFSVCSDLQRRGFGGSGALFARALRWVAGVVVALSALFFSSRASAAAPVTPEPVHPQAAEGSEAEAPMCDPVGASVAARPEVPLAKSGRLEPLPCDAGVDALELWLSGARTKVAALAVDDREPTQPSPWLWSGDRVEGAPLPSPVALSDSPLSRILAAVSDGLSQRRGHPRGPYRPPASRF